MTSTPTYPIANPKIVLREEFDDTAILFDPDSGTSFGLNPVSLFIWRQLDGRHSLEDILRNLKSRCRDVPDQAEEHLRHFITDLVERGIVGYEIQSASPPSR